MNKEEKQIIRTNLKIENIFKEKIDNAELDTLEEMELIGAALEKGYCWTGNKCVIVDETVDGDEVLVQIFKIEKKSTWVSSNHSFLKQCRKIANNE